MRKTRNYKKSRSANRRRTRRTRRGGYWLYPSETDNESSFSKLFSFGKSKSAVPSTSNVISTPSELPPPPPPVEIKAIDTPEPESVPAVDESVTEEVEVEEEKESPTDNYVGGKRRYRRRRGGEPTITGGNVCDAPPCINGGKRKSMRRKSSKKRRSQKKSKTSRKSRKSRKSAYKKRK